MSRILKLVLIEDDADDVEILQDALDNHQVSYELTVLKDGSAGVDFCENSNLIPDIIIMDFNLPRVHGRELIKVIRSQTRFAGTPILILSTSSSKEDIAFAYGAGANKYLVKPTDLNSINLTIQTIRDLAEKKVVTTR